MKWHEIGKTYGYPIAFRWPTWNVGDYIVAYSETDIEVYRDSKPTQPKDKALGTLLSLTLYWSEHDGWEPLFGFY